MEDLSYTIQQTTWVIFMSHQLRTIAIISFFRAEAVSSVKSQLEEAISCRLGSEPGKSRSAGQWWRHPPTLISPTLISPTLSVRYADSSSSEDHSDYVLLDREEENWKFIKTINCSFLPSNRDSGISGTNRFLSNSSRDPEFNISLPVYWVQSKYS